KKFLGKDPVFIGILIFTCFTIFFSGLDSRPLWDIDEATHAVVSKEMILSGDWITPTFNDEPFYDKPVLHSWLVALSFLLLGFTEFAARLPSAVLGTGCVMVTYLLGRRLFDPTVGFLSGLILATAIEFIVVTRSVVQDISLLFFITFALYLFYTVYRNSRHGTLSLFLFYAVLGFAVLAKGPVGLLLPAATIGLYLIFVQDLGFIKHMKLGWGMLVFAVVAVPWYILISSKNPEYASYFFIERNIGSFLSATKRHPEPFYYYIPVFFGGFFPWSCFVPPAIFYALRRRFEAHARGALYPLIWFAVVFVFNTPQASIRKGSIISFLPVGIIFVAAAGCIWVNPPAEIEYESGLNLNYLKHSVVWLAVCAVLAFVFLLKQKDKACFTTIAAMIATTLLLFLLVFAPAVNPFRSTKQLAAEYDRLAPEDERFVFYGRILESALFYHDRKAIVLDTPEELQQYLNSNNRVYCILTTKDMRRIADLRQSFDVVGQQANKFLITNKR
ncbi:MAG: glycosyltransferase family 39 protein, partial [Desulfobacterales bacterium]